MRGAGERKRGVPGRKRAYYNYMDEERAGASENNMLSGAAQAPSINIAPYHARMRGVDRLPRPFCIAVA